MSLRAAEGGYKPDKPFQRPGKPNLEVVPDEYLYDKDTELATLSAFLQYPKLLVSTSNELTSNEFGHPENRAMYDALVSLNSKFARENKGKQLTSINPSVLQEHLREEGLLNKAITVDYLSQLYSNPYSTTDEVESFVKILRDYSLRRKMDRDGQELRLRARDKTGPVDRFLNTFYQKVGETLTWLTSGKNDVRFRTFASRRENYLLELNGGTLEWRNPADVEKQPVKGVQRELCEFGLDALDGTLDKKTGKRTNRKAFMGGGKLITLLADTSVGKSTLAHQIAIYNAKTPGRRRKGRHILFFVNELTATDMEDREISMLSGIPLTKIQEHRKTLDVFSEDEWETLKSVHTNMICAYPGEIDYVTCSDWSGSMIYNFATQQDRAKLAEKGHGYDLIIVDYLQKVDAEPGEYRLGRTEFTNRNVTMMSQLAINLDIPVLLTSQVGGSREGGADREENIVPGKHSAKESSAVEDRTQILVGLHRSVKEPSVATIQILKNTNGPTTERMEIEYLTQSFKFQDKLGSKDD